MLFFFNDTATTEIYTLSLHDALPIWVVFFDRDRNGVQGGNEPGRWGAVVVVRNQAGTVVSEARTERDGSYQVDGLQPDRKSTRLNSSHANISYAVFCLKKKKNVLRTP